MNRMDLKTSSLLISLAILHVTTVQVLTPLIVPLAQDHSTIIMGNA